MEELEDPTEKLRETIETVEEERDKKERWTLSVALTTSIVAVLAAIAGLFGNHHANEALLEQMNASDKWNFYQAKGIKLSIENNSAVILSAINKDAPPANKEKIEKYEKEKEEIMKEAKEAEAGSKEHLQRHVIISKAVTIFQVAIALSGIAILTRRKPIWYVSMLMAVLGIFFLVQGLI